jgi:arylsulfatase A-like enzyme
MVQTNLRIPLVLAWPRGLPQGRRVAAQVDEIDVFPTVCDLLGIDLPPGAANPGTDRERVDGASLLPLVRGEKDIVRLHSFAENGPQMSVQDGRRKLVVGREALTDPDGWKKAFEGKPAWPQLVDLEGDPEEKFNRFQREREEAERLFAVMRDWNEKLPIPVHLVQTSARDRENMELLLDRFGYTGGGIGQDPAPK